MLNLLFQRMANSFMENDQLWNTALVTMTASSRLRRLALKCGAIGFIVFGFLLAILPANNHGIVLIFGWLPFLFSFTLLVCALLASGAALVARIAVPDAVKTFKGMIDPA